MSTPRRVCALLTSTLETLLAHARDREIRFWQDARKREVDFILVSRDGRCDAIECEWRPDHYSANNLEVFRSAYADGNNYVVSLQVGEPYRITR